MNCSIFSLKYKISDVILMGWLTRLIQVKLTWIVFHSDMEGLLTALSTIGKGCITFALTCAYFYTSEMFPTPVRHISLGTSSTVARVGSMLSPFLGSALVSIMHVGVGMLLHILYWYIPVPSPHWWFDVEFGVCLLIYIMYMYILSYFKFKSVSWWWALSSTIALCSTMFELVPLIIDNTY